MVRGRGGEDAAGSELRILLTADAVGGVWTYAVELSRALSRRGHRTLLACMGGAPSPARRAEARGVEGLELRARDFRLEWMDDPWDDVARAREWLLELSAEWRPDVVHLNGYAHGDAPFDPPVLVVGHSCVVSWWEAVRGGPPPVRFDRYRSRVRRGLAGADRVAAPTRAMADLLERHHRPPRTVSVLPNGRSRADFDPAPGGERVLGCGRLWDAAKNLEALDRVAARLPWPVEVAGDLLHPDGSTRPPRHATALGPLEPAEVAARMRGASILAHPARYEPFGLVPLEAALSGCALVLGDVPTLREVWGDAALFVDPDEPDELEAALGRLIDRPDERASLAARARERARRYTPDRMAARYLALYRDMIAAPAGVELTAPTPPVEEPAWT